LATPECQDPWELVRFVKAGDRILERIGREAGRTGDKENEILIFRGNVDYSGSRTTWGSHESYLHRVGDDRLSEQLLPHLVSRVVFSGAGGFNPLSSGIEFTLSPRAWHLRVAVSESSTRDRGIFNTRNESLCGHGYRRLHLLCSDGLCSETGLWLTVATTALIVAAIEADSSIGLAMRLTKPVGALRAFVSDPDLKAVAELTTGQKVSALEIQRHYLEQVERGLDDEVMPPWAETVCRRWRETLAALEKPERLALTLDWAVKHMLYRERLQRSRLNARRLKFWNKVVERLQAELVRVGATDPEVSLSHLLGPKSPVREKIDALTPVLRGQGLTWDDFNAFLTLRGELLEIDTRYGQLGEDGLFAGMDRAGVLRHQVPGVEPIAAAVSNPPANGRAQLRGNAIRRLAGEKGACCNWSTVWDPKQKQKMDLSNPFETEERWKNSRGRLISQLGLDAPRDLFEAFRTMDL
jgi:hypothetical protein